MIRRWASAAPLSVLCSLGCTGEIGAPAPVATPASPSAPGPTAPADPADPADPPPAPSVARVELRAPITVLAVGQQVVVSATAYDAADRALSGVELAFSSSAPSVARVDAEGRVEAVAAGEAEILARAGEVASAPIRLRVLPARAPGDASVRVRGPADAAAALQVGASVVLSAAVRDDRGALLADAEVIFESADPAVATVGAHGEVEAVGPGRAAIVARYRDAVSPPYEVRVVDSETFLDVWIEAPSAEVTAARTVRVQARVQQLEVSSSRRVGVPVRADAAVALVDGVEVGSLDVGFGEVHGALGVDGLAPGAHALRVEVRVGGATVRSAPRSLRLVSVDEQTWTEVGQHAAEEARLVEVQSSLQMAATTCRRTCEASWYVAGANGFEPLEYRYEWHRDWQGDRSRRESTGSVFGLARFVGWGWFGIATRGLDVEPGARIVAWSNEEQRRGFNVEDMPERFWFECQVAEWDPSAGLDGAGSWRLLTEDRAAWHTRRPHPDEMVAEWGATENLRFPRGTDTERTRDCDYPRLARGPSGERLVVQLTGAVPGPEWRLEVRRWTGAEWVTHAPPRPVAGGTPALSRVATDAAGRLQVVLHEEGVPRLLVLEGETWRAPPGAPDPVAIAPTEAGTLAVSVAGGDARVYLGGAEGWAPLGDRLDVDPWADVHEASVASLEGQIFVAWTEGPAVGNRDLYVATWRADEARWVRLGAGPAELDPDRAAFDPQLLVRADGHLALRYAEPSTSDAPTMQRVRSTAARVMP